MVKRKAAGQISSDEDRMYADIYDAVMGHRLPPQTKLTELGLCEIYGLARHSVRKVLAQLAEDGLVDLLPNRGAYIASPSSQEGSEMFELRQALERLVVQNVADQASAARLTHLKDMVQREHEAWNKGDRQTWIRLSADFHVELAKLSGNALLTDMLRRLVSRTTLLIASIESPRQNVCSFDDHLDILAKLEAGDKSGAVKSMARHLSDCAQRSTKTEEKQFDLKSVLMQS